jgi:hypothetical protein
LLLASGMGKRTKKLLVDLDQNFLSEMSKADVNGKVRPEFKEIYELLHQGFVDEKIVVPSSLLHDIESSLATHLKDRINTYQHYLGQVRLRRPDEIENAQTDAALCRYIGRPSEDLLKPRTAFLDDPDQRVERFGISVDAHWETHNFRQTRHATAKDLEALRQRCLQSKVTYEQQARIERDHQKQEFVETYERYSDTLSHDRRKELLAFAASAEFAAIPLLRIEAHLYATILTRMALRKIKPSDTTDIEVLSAYLPYMDVVCTDAFMAEQLRGIAKEYGVTVFHGKTTSLRDMKAFLEEHLKNAAPVRRPSITAFVLPPKNGRDGSFQFFFQLGAALRAMGINEYGELYAFDNGAMSKYELPQLPGKPVPFYGLQDVPPIDLPAGSTEEQILEMCRARCRSYHFVLIDAYKDIKDTFMLGAAMSAEANLDETEGYRIFEKHS